MLTFTYQRYVYGFVSIGLAVRPSVRPAVRPSGRPAILHFHMNVLFLKYY